MKGAALLHCIPHSDPATLGPTDTRFLTAADSRSLRLDGKAAHVVAPHSHLPRVVLGEQASMVNTVILLMGCPG